MTKQEMIEKFIKNYFKNPDDEFGCHHLDEGTIRHCFYDFVQAIQQTHHIIDKDAVEVVNDCEAKIGDLIFDFSGLIYVSREKTLRECYSIIQRNNKQAINKEWVL